MAVTCLGNERRDWGGATVWLQYVDFVIKISDEVAERVWYLDIKFLVLFSDIGKNLENSMKSPYHCPKVTKNFLDSIELFSVYRFFSDRAVLARHLGGFVRHSYRGQAFSKSPIVKSAWGFRK